MNIALIFAGGVGLRMNSQSLPKQFLKIHGKAIIIHTIEIFENHPEIDQICVVCVEGWIDYLKSLIEKANLKKVKWILKGGTTALESQYIGIKTIAEDLIEISKIIILIHDGVRPLIDNKTISSCIESVKKRGSAITIAPATETIVTTDGAEVITGTIKRSDCYLARAPQAFFLAEILSIHNQSKNENNNKFIDSASLMLYYKKKIYTVEGPSENIKITTPSDFYIYRALLDAKENLKKEEYV